MTSRPVRRIARERKPREGGGGDGSGATAVFTYGPLERIVNVHWEGGLAVEFEPDNT